MLRCTLTTIIVLFSLMVLSDSTNPTVNTFFGNYYFMETADLSYYYPTYYAWSIDPVTNRPHVYRLRIGDLAANEYFLTLVYYEKKVKQYVYEEFLNIGDVEYITYKSPNLNIMPWDNCPSTTTYAAGSYVGGFAGGLSIPLKSNMFDNYLTANAVVYSASCPLTNPAISITSTFVFGAIAPFNNTYFYTNGFTSISIQQVNQYGSEAALTSAVGNVFRPFYATQTPIGILIPPLNPSTTSTTIYGTVPTGSTSTPIYNFPYGWTQFYSSCQSYFITPYIVFAASLEFVDQILFIDESNGFNQYACSFPDTATVSPIAQLDTYNSVSIEGYTIVQTNLWYFGTSNVLPYLPAICGNGNAYYCQYLYRGCQLGSGNTQQPGLTVVPGGSGSTCSWSGGTGSPIDIFLNIPFPAFYIFALRYYDNWYQNTYIQSATKSYGTQTVSVACPQ